MGSSPQYFSSSTLGVLKAVFDEAWQELLKAETPITTEESEASARELLAKRIIECAGGGETDPVRLKRCALAGMPGLSAARSEDPFHRPAS